MSRTDKLHGRLAVVTGSARGLGRSMAITLAGEGARVAIHYKTRKEEAALTVAHLRNGGAEAMAFQADLCSWDETQNLISAVLKHFGRIDILVNNVGPFGEKSFLETTPLEWREMLDGNLLTTVHACRAVWPFMQEQKYGRIINLGLASADRIHAYQNIIPYGIAKTGVLILSKSLAVEGAPFGITVNVLAPGLMNNGDLSESESARLAKKIPGGRTGTAGDLGAALLFLAGEASAYVTGAQIPVSGGWGL